MFPRYKEMLQKSFLQHLLFVFLDKRPTRGWSWGRESNATNQPLFCAVAPSVPIHILPLRQVAQVVP